MNRKLQLLFFFFLLINFRGFSQIKYSNDFLHIGAGARSLSLSKSVVANSINSSAIYWNPAALIHVKGNEIEIMHASYFSGIANFDQISYVRQRDTTAALGFMILRFGVDDIMNTTNLIDNQGNLDYNRIELFSTADYAFFLSYAKRDFFNGINIGGNLKIVYRHIGDFAKAWGFGFDFGMQKDFGKWKWGIISRDATSTFNSWIFETGDFQDVYLQTNNELPENSVEITLPSIQAGIARLFVINNIISGHIEFDIDAYLDGKRNTLYSNNLFSLNPHLGLEMGLREIVYLRFGAGDLIKEVDFNNEDYISLKPNIGLGVNFENLRIDYALTNLGGQSSGMYSNLFSIIINFK